MNRNLAETAALLSDPGRAEILTSLLGGMALPAGELARIANVAPQTASSHLAKLVQGQLLSVEQQGRHRYYRLADAEVAHAIEALLAIAPRVTTSKATVSARTDSGSITYARSCYTHLAGNVAVQFADAMQTRKLLVAKEGKLFLVTATGRRWLEDFGISIRDRDIHDRRFARCCLDWTERRHHIAGRLGSAILTRLRELKWIAPVRDSRAVRVTLEGQCKLADMLGVH